MRGFVHVNTPVVPRTDFELTNLPALIALEPHS
jgi:hypothetical protein